MAADVRLEMARLADVSVPSRSLLRVRLPFRRSRGLEGIPERYRLQFLLLASERRPGGSPEAVAGLADRLAARVRVPDRLLKLENPERLDAWFRDHREHICSLLDGLG